jgi:hypothetical protein
LIDFQILNNRGRKYEWIRKRTRSGKRRGRRGWRRRNGRCGTKSNNKLMDEEWKVVEVVQKTSTMFVPKEATEIGVHGGLGKIAYTNKGKHYYQFLSRLRTMWSDTWPKGTQVFSEACNGREAWILWPARRISCHQEQKCELCDNKIHCIDDIIALNRETEQTKETLSLCEDCFDDKADHLRGKGWNVDDIFEEEEDEDEVYYQQYQCNKCNFKTTNDDPHCSKCNKSGCMYAMVSDENDDTSEEDSEQEPSWNEDEEE